MNLAIKFARSFLPLLLLLLLQSGCTYALWTNGNLVAYKEPAQNPDLRLFQATQQSDFLVVYNEHSERTDSIHKRAYWLKKNQQRVTDQKAPTFAHCNLPSHLSEIPVFYSAPETNFVRGVYAVCDTNQETFKLFSGNTQIGSYDFPVYRDHWGNVEKVALTPVAVTADVAVAGGIVAVLAAYAMAQNNCTIPLGR